MTFTVLPTSRVGYGDTLTESICKVWIIKSLKPFRNICRPLPEAPTADEVEKDPSLAVYTYLRQECLRCHTGGKGRSRRGDYRGMGCARLPHSILKWGVLWGLTIAQFQKIRGGIFLPDQIQSSRKVNVSIHDINYSGIPVETCYTPAHNLR